MKGITTLSKIETRTLQGKERLLKPASRATRARPPAMDPRSAISAPESPVLLPTPKSNRTELSSRIWIRLQSKIILETSWPYKTWLQKSKGKNRNGNFNSRILLPLSNLSKPSLLHPWTSRPLSHRKEINLWKGRTPLAQCKTLPPTPTNSSLNNNR